MKLRDAPDLTTASKDIAASELAKANASLVLAGLTYADGSLLVGDSNGKAIRGFTDGARDATKDIAAAILQSANSNISIVDIAWDGTSLLVLDGQAKAVWGFTNGARDTSKDIAASVLQSANGSIVPAGITYDGTSVLVADSNEDSVWAITNGARDTSKDIAKATLRSANSNIRPAGLAWDGTSVLVGDSNEDAVWGFTSGARASSKDITASELAKANASIVVASLTSDGVSVLIGDSQADAVYSFTDGKRDSDVAEAKIVVTDDATKTSKPRVTSVQETIQIQEEVNPFIIKSQEVVLASFSPSNYASDTNANLLNYKEGTTRWTWGEFQTLKFEVVNEADIEISSVSFQASTTTERINLKYSTNLLQVWYDSTNGFRLELLNASNQRQNQSNTFYLKAVHGVQMRIEREKTDV